MPETLNAFWEITSFGTLWEDVRPDYMTELNKYDFGRMSNQLDRLWKYLREERKDPFTLVNVPNLHEYLHSVVNPLVEVSLEASRQNRFWSTR